jgi:intracellular sulfur oxidation DsrE/DsrF family protein
VVSQNHGNVSLRACANALAKMSQRTRRQTGLMPQAKRVPCGVIHLVERQEQGWACIRP